MNIAVIHGGNSTECQVSTLNAEYINSSLKELGYNSYLLGFNKDMYSSLLQNKPDVVFLCVQGKGHGDGTLQGILDSLEIPYTGSKREASTIINNKIFCQKLFKLENLPTAPSFTWSRKEHFSPKGKDTLLGKMQMAEVLFPCVVKAPSQGGSFGIAYLESMEDFHKIDSIFQYDEVLLIEKFIKGRFYTVGLLEHEGKLLTLPTMEGVAVNSDAKLISFDGKYTVHKAELSAEINDKMAKYAKDVFRCINASGYGRVDFILEESSNIPIILEINAVPGLKPQSLYPPSALLIGIEYNKLIDIILASATFKV